MIALNLSREAVFLILAAPLSRPDPVSRRKPASAGRFFFDTGPLRSVPRIRWVPNPKATSEALHDRADHRDSELAGDFRFYRRYDAETFR
jgi:hypothetical protein